MPIAAHELSSTLIYICIFSGNRFAQAKESHRQRKKETEETEANNNNNKTPPMHTHTHGTHAQSIDFTTTENATFRDFSFNLLLSVCDVVAGVSLAFWLAFVCFVDF